MTCAWSSPFIWTEQGDAGGGEGGRRQASAGEASIRITFISSPTRRQQKIRLGDSAGGGGGGAGKRSPAKTSAVRWSGWGLFVSRGVWADNQLCRAVRHGEPGKGGLPSVPPAQRPWQGAASPPGGTAGHPPARPRVPPGRLLRTAPGFCVDAALGRKGTRGTKLVHVLPFPEQGSALFCQTRGNPGSAHRAARSASSKAATRFLMTTGGLINVPCSAWHRLAP